MLRIGQNPLCGRSFCHRKLPGARRSRTCITAEYEKGESRSKTGKGTKKKTGATQATLTPTEVSPEAQRKAVEANRSILDHPEVAGFLRRTGLHMTDGTLLLGDAIMVLTTHFASDLIPLNDLGIYSSVAALCWVGSAYAKGDYSLTQSYPEDGWLTGLPGYSVFVGVRESAFAWVLFVPIVSTAFASLVIHGAIDAAPLMVVQEGCKVSPELEVIVALAVTVPCWRGLYYAMRDGILP